MQKQLFRKSINILTGVLMLISQFSNLLYVNNVPMAHATWDWQKTTIQKWDTCSDTDGCVCSITGHVDYNIDNTKTCNIGIFDTKFYWVLAWDATTAGSGWISWFRNPTTQNLFADNNGTGNPYFKYLTWVYSSIYTISPTATNVFNLIFLNTEYVSSNYYSSRNIYIIPLQSIEWIDLFTGLQYVDLVKTNLQKVNWIQYLENLTGLVLPETYNKCKTTELSNCTTGAVQGSWVVYFTWEYTSSNPNNDVNIDFNDGRYHIKSVSGGTTLSINKWCGTSETNNSFLASDGNTYSYDMFETSTVATGATISNGTNILNLTCDNGVIVENGTGVVCADGYNLVNGACSASTKSADCSAKPDNTLRNTSSTYTQTLVGWSRVPTTYPSTHSDTPWTCTYKCDTNFTRSGDTQSCLAKTQSQDCTWLPDNASWNTYTSIIQTWSGTTSKFEPSNVWEHWITADSTKCLFTCNTNYTRSGEAQSCLADKQIQSCSTLPANAQRNNGTGQNIVQTWNGTDWYPNLTATFSGTLVDNACVFKCNDKYTWNENTQACEADVRLAQPCIGKIANSVWNGSWYVDQTWNGTARYPSLTWTYYM